jgi:hypothetical protein
VKVSQVVCSPLLKKITPEALAVGQEVFVNLRKEHTQHHPFSVGPFTGEKREEFPLRNNEGGYVTDEFTTVEISVGKFAVQNIRCAIRDHRGRPIEAKRGENIDVTFSDADKGEWKFLVPEKSLVYDVICDPKFKSAGGA